MKKWSLLFLAVVVLTSLSACGGGASTTINVTLAEFSFTPSEFTIPAGKEITVNAVNNGAVTHDFILMKLGKNVTGDFTDADKPNIYWKLEAAPGSTVTGTFTAPMEPGVYQIVCGVPGHFMAGMSGKLTVVVP